MVICSLCSYHLRPEFHIRQAFADFGLASVVASAFCRSPVSGNADNTIIAGQALYVAANAAC